MERSPLRGGTTASMRAVSYGVQRVWRRCDAEVKGLVILLDTLARFSRDRGRPARPGRRPAVDNPPKARRSSSGRDARDPREAHSRDEL